jgi:YD repeat-containing protein
MTGFCSYSASAVVEYETVLQSHAGGEGAKMHKQHRVLNWQAWAFTIALALLGASGGNPALAANGSVLYTYDALGRIITATYDTGVIVIYIYDSNRNRLSQTINVNTATFTWTATANPCTSNCWGQGLW